MIHDPPLSEPFVERFAALPEVKFSGPRSSFHGCFGCGPQHEIGLRVRTFGAGEEVLALVRPRGDLALSGDRFSNDGPELVVPAGKVELEISDLLKGTWAVDADGFVLRFPMKDFTVRACLRIAIFRKCFDLREIRATRGSIELDFGGPPADRRYVF